MKFVNIRSFFIVYVGVLRKLPPSYELKKTCALCADVRQAEGCEASRGNAKQIERMGLS